MLQSISIVNFALIDDIQSDFGPQLNVVTGETGSGKSIVMDALSLVLGARADLSAVRDASKKCIVEVVFDLSKTSLHSVFDDLEGIGPKRKKILMLHFGSIEKLKSATIEDLRKIKNIPIKKLEEIYEFFNS